jgi:hypothetical protein
MRGPEAFPSSGLNRICPRHRWFAASSAAVYGTGLTHVAGQGTAWLFGWPPSNLSILDGIILGLVGYLYVVFRQRCRRMTQRHATIVSLFVGGAMAVAASAHLVWFITLDMQTRPVAVPALFLVLVVGIPSVLAFVGGVSLVRVVLWATTRKRQPNATGSRLGAARPAPIATGRCEQNGPSANPREWLAPSCRYPRKARVRLVPQVQGVAPLVRLKSMHAD